MENNYSIIKTQSVYNILRRSYGNTDINENGEHGFYNSAIISMRRLSDMKKVIVFGYARYDVPYHFHYTSLYPLDNEYGFNFEIKIENICNLEVCRVVSKYGKVVNEYLPDAWYVYEKEKEELKVWLNEISINGDRYWMHIPSVMCLVEGKNIPFKIDIGKENFFFYNRYNKLNGEYIVDENSDDLKITFFDNLIEGVDINTKKRTVLFNG